MTKRRKADEEQIGKLILKIQEHDGVCTPDAFVDAVSAEDHPLHDLFEWDDSVAARAWREHQARALIGRYQITISGQRTPAYVHVQITGDNGARREGYVSVEQAMANAQLREQVFSEARAGLQGWARRLSAFEHAEPALKKLTEAIDLLANEGEEEPPDDD